ncbi:MAG TPA: hypothetical protein VFE32_13795 [Puia sp.]|jgi:hypothetical protein|nr:hypothetical protein [Puia sp.]
MDIYFEGHLTEIKEVPANKQYWFIRTYSGEAYNSYLDGGYVGLGYNDVPYEYIKNATALGGSASPAALYNYVQNNPEYKGQRIGRIVNQLISFNRDVSIGDCVVMPSRNSDILAIGTVESDVYLVKEPGTILLRGKYLDLPEKRRKVRWEKSILKDDPANEIKSISSSHYGITNANFYSDAIEGILSSLFLKNRHACLVIQIDQHEEINAFELNRFLTQLTYFYQQFCVESGVLANEDLTIKIKLQSRGKMLLKASVIAGVIGLAGMVTLSNNSKVKVDIEKKTVEGSSDGLLKSISDFLDRSEERRERRKIFDDSIANLKAHRDMTSKLIQDTSNQPKEDGK